MRRYAVTIGLVVLLAMSSSPAEAGGPPEDTPSASGGAHLRLNHLQARGTHNSYHRDPMLPIVGAGAGWDYSHRMLEAQFEEQDVRQIELDIHYNWAKDDFENYHVGIDSRSTCELFRECLDQVKRWSDARPHHHPILILVEPKDGGPPRDVDLPEDGSPLTHPIREPEYDKLDRLIGEHPISERLITPDDLTVPGKTLRESILTRGWPRIAEVRGHVLFLVDGSEHGHDYSRGWTSLEGRPMFVQAPTSGEAIHPVSAFVTRSGGGLPGEGKYDRMRRLVAQGFMVRDLVSSGPFETAKAAGAHFISTDFPEDLELSTDPEAPSRCNPVSAPRCEDRRIETRVTEPPYDVPEDPEDTQEQAVADHVDHIVVNSVEDLVACASRLCVPPADRMLDL